MKATLTRTETSTAGTFGTLTIDGKSWRTGELPWVDNKPSMSCIPPGTYQVEVVKSPKFGPDTYEIKAVPDRSHVLIHAGNFCGDISCGLKSDVEGCILLGKDVIPLLNDKKAMQKGVSQSKVAMAEFKALTQNKPFELTIVDATVAPDAA